MTVDLERLRDVIDMGDARLYNSDIRRDLLEVLDDSMEEERLIEQHAETIAKLEKKLKVYETAPSDIDREVCKTAVSDIKSEMDKIVRVNADLTGATKRIYETLSTLGNALND